VRVREDDREDYDERRFGATGFSYIDFSPRGESICAISLRRATPQEARRHANDQD
jgi:uncharacterized DUF497 family protein